MLIVILGAIVSSCSNDAIQINEGESTSSLSSVSTFKSKDYSPYKSSYRVVDNLGIEAPFIPGTEIGVNNDEKKKIAFSDPLRGKNWVYFEELKSEDFVTKDAFIESACSLVSEHWEVADMQNRAVKYWASSQQVELIEIECPIYRGLYSEEPVLLVLKVNDRYFEVNFRNRNRDLSQLVYIISWSKQLDTDAQLK